MKTARYTMLMLMLILTLGLFAGCSEDDSSPTTTSSTAMDDYEGLDFSMPYGGLTMSDELEAFDDEALKEMMYAEEGEMEDDEFASLPEVQELLERGDDPSDPDNPTRPRFTFLRLRWGMIHGPDDEFVIPEEGCGLTNWDGELHTDRGIVLVKRVVAFERPMDTLIRPRLNPQTVAFLSKTGCRYDGLVIQIIERGGEFDQEDLEPNMLHINTPGFSGSFAVSELSEIDEVFEVGSEGNSFQMNGFTLSDIDYCPKGFLSGRYRTMPEELPADAPEGEDRPGEQLGTYAGMWTTLEGRTHGFLRGGYGLDEDGNRVFFGKYIDRSGHFRGLLVGTWDPAAEDETMMAGFNGHWVNAAGTTEGLLGGNAHPVQDYPGGFFEGRWTTLCDDQAENTI
jgi:hypothetical protein